MEFGVGGCLLSRNYFSTYQLWAAEFAAESARFIETNYDGRIPIFLIEQRACVMNAVFMSVGFLEAAINETLQDIVDGYTSYVGNVDPVIRRCIAVWWGQSEGQGRAAGSILDKYQSLLAFYGLPTLDKGRNPYQDVEQLVRLRNELMHYKPEMLGGDERHRWEKKLRPKFLTNPLLAGSSNPYFPDHCLGSGSAAWAVQSAKEFADTYFAMLGISPNYTQATWTKPTDIISRRFKPRTKKCDDGGVTHITPAIVFNQQPRLHELESSLTKFGGDPYIILSGDRLGGCLSVPELDRLICEGRLVDFTPVFRPGKENECHENCLALFEKDETLTVMSGFALANDCKWYHHTWCVDERDGQKRLIETVWANKDSDDENSWKFLRYFGIEYVGREEVKKLREWLDGEMPKAPPIKPGSLGEISAAILEAE